MPLQFGSLLYNLWISFSSTWLKCFHKAPSLLMPLGQQLVSHTIQLAFFFFFFGAPMSTSNRLPPTRNVVIKVKFVGVIVISPTSSKWNVWAVSHHFSTKATSNGLSIFFPSPKIETKGKNPTSLILSWILSCIAL